MNATQPNMAHKKIRLQHGWRWAPIKADMANVKLQIAFASIVMYCRLDCN